MGMNVVVSPRPYYRAEDVDVDELADLAATVTPQGTYPHATTILREVVVYDMNALTPVISTREGRREVMAEIAHALREGPGVVALRGAVPRDVLDRATNAFEWMITEQYQSGVTSGDHFAMVGANDRVWNALEKLAVAEPEVFVDYYASDAIALAAAAWLGPGYQISSQLNVVRPGGAAQSPHRDYHLGFMTDAQAEPFPGHAHLLSPMLTLQGAVAHVDMPVASGPTKLLPHSQKYPAGYVAWRRPDVIELFEDRCVQLPLAAGDAVFFNPALLHAAGSNHTATVRRMANLLQISSAMGRSMETVDRTRVMRAVYPVLLDRQAAGWDAAALHRAIAASAEGYAFPTNLDRDPPIGGLAPSSQADIVRQALADRWTPEQLDDALTALDDRRLSHH
jgi:ectoine hydroxylase-related dioxygenase (phytanoyl-CoA dioxygenase family)